jgi:hypothetical protein
MVMMATIVAFVSAVSAGLVPAVASPAAIVPAAFTPFGRVVVVVPRRRRRVVVTWTVIAR